MKIEIIEKRLKFFKLNLKATGLNAKWRGPLEKEFKDGLYKMYDKGMEAVWEKLEEIGEKEDGCPYCGG